MSLCLVRLIEPIFRSIEHRVSGFLKTILWLIQPTFSKLFQLLLSLFDFPRLNRRFFVVFDLIFARFFFHKAGKTFIPLLLFLFSCFHALFHAFKGYFRTSLNLGFLLIQCYFSEMIIGFCWYIVIYMIVVG